jgi:hypothetical protein
MFNEIGEFATPGKPGSQEYSSVVKYDRVRGLPEGRCYALMKVECFGEMGGPYYKDSILYYAETLSDLEEFCEQQKYPLNKEGGWNEYFITEYNS